MEYGIWKIKQVKSYLNKISVFDKTWKQIAVFDTSFENKTIWRVTRLQSKTVFRN